MTLHAFCLLGLWITHACHAEAQPIDQRYKLQIDNESRTKKFCNDQWVNASYFSAIQKDKEHGLRLDGDLLGGLAGYHFITTSKGVQGVNSGTLQQESGKWKCDRGVIDKPMLLGKEYFYSRPVYEQRPGCSPYEHISFDGLLSPPPRHCFGPSRVIGHISTSKMLKEEACDKGAMCLILYNRNELGKVSRYLIGVSLRSLQALYPYSLTKGELWHGMEYEYHAGPADLACSDYPGNKDISAYMRQLYQSCLKRVSLGWK